MSRERVLDKLAKIMRLAASERELGNEAAADNFAQIVQKLMLQHEIEISEIKLEESESLSDDMGKTYFSYHYHGMPFKRVRAWQHTLATAVATAHFCELLVPSTAKEPWVVFAGKPANRMVCVYMFEVLARTAVNLAGIKYLEAWKLELKGGDVRVLRGFKESFLDAFANRISVRYAQLAVDQARQESVALVIRSIESQLQEYLKDLKPCLNSPSSGDNGNSIGRRYGAIAAETVSLHANAVSGGTHDQVHRGDRSLT